MNRPMMEAPLVWEQIPEEQRTWIIAFLGRIALRHWQGVPKKEEPNGNATNRNQAVAWEENS